MQAPVTNVNAPGDTETLVIVSGNAVTPQTQEDIQ
jgi:hypothetical protein